MTLLNIYFSSFRVDKDATLPCLIQICLKKATMTQMTEQVQQPMASITQMAHSSTMRLKITLQVEQIATNKVSKQKFREIHIKMAVLQQNSRRSKQKLVVDNQNLGGSTSISFSSRVFLVSVGSSALLFITEVSLVIFSCEKLCLDDQPSLMYFV